MRSVILLLCLLAGVSAFTPSTLPLVTSTRRMRASAPAMCAAPAPRDDEAGRMERRSAIASVLASLIALPAAARANEVSDVLAKKSPNDVVQFLLDKLAKNNSPAPDAGLKTLISATSPANPNTKDPEKFIDFMKKGAYQILLGKYDAIRMAPANTGVLKSGNYGSTVTIRLDSTVRKFAAMGVDPKYLFVAEEELKESDSAGAGDMDSKLFVIMEFQLSKDPSTSAWQVDSVYFVPIEAMRA